MYGVLRYRTVFKFRTYRANIQNVLELRIINHKLLLAADNIVSVFNFRSSACIKTIICSMLVTVSFIKIQKGLLKLMPAGIIP